MAIILYKKGTSHNILGISCTAQVWKDTHFDFPALEKAGWFLSPEDIYKNEVTDKPESIEPEPIMEIPDTPKDDEEETIRQMAKEAGIKSWHLKSINKLKEEMDLAE